MRKEVQWKFIVRSLRKLKVLFVVSTGKAIHVAKACTQVLLCYSPFQLLASGPDRKPKNVERIIRQMRKEEREREREANWIIYDSLTSGKCRTNIHICMKCREMQNLNICQLFCTSLDFKVLQVSPEYGQHVKFYRSQVFTSCFILCLLVT